MQIVMTMPYHARHPEISYGPYLQDQRLALGEQLASVVKVYLDTKFWLNFRDVRLGRKKNAQLTELLALLEKLVAANKAVCPLSAQIYLEIFAQSDVNTLTASVELIDELSRGICLIENDECIQLEAFYFIRQLVNGPTEVHALEKLVWTKTAHVLGPATPSLIGVGNNTNTAVQKAFMDHLWTVSLVDFLDLMGDERSSRAIPDISQALNDGKLPTWKIMTRSMTCS